MWKTCDNKAMLQMFRHSSHDKELNLTVSTRTVLRVVIVILLCLLLVRMASRASHELTLIFTAFFFTLAFNAPVHWVSRHLPGKLHGKRASATAVSFFVIIIVLGGFLTAIMPSLVHQTQSFIAAAPHIIKDTQNQNSAVGKFVRSHNLEGQVTKLSHQLSDRLGNIGGAAFSTATRIGSSIFSVLTILVLTFMMLVEGPRWLEFGRELVPTNKHDKVDRLTKDMYRVIRGYINGQVTLAALASALILPALFVLHIGNPLALVVVIFICGLIPLVGHTIGAVIVTFVALFHSPSAAAIILAYYILYQQIENYVIQPRIQSNSTDMSPLLVFTSVILGVSFSGLIGGLVAIPLAGCLRIVLLDYLRTNKMLNPANTEIRAEEARASSDTK
jgi:predicted PurR-regulated permease PerM